MKFVKIGTKVFNLSAVRHVELEKADWKEGLPTMVVVDFSDQVAEDSANQLWFTGADAIQARELFERLAAE